MNFQVNFYDKETKRFTHTEMIPLTVEEIYDEDGNFQGTKTKKILPEYSTELLPPNLASDPAFNEDLNEWVPQKPIPPVDSYSLEEKLKRSDSLISELTDKVEALSVKVETLEVEIDAPSKDSVTVESHGRRIKAQEELLQRTRYYLTVALPNAKHFFE